MTIAPRDYRQPGRVLKQDLSTLLAGVPRGLRLPRVDRQGFQPRRTGDGRTGCRRLHRKRRTGAEL